MKRLVLCCLLATVFATAAFPQSAELGISAGYGALNDNSISVQEIPQLAGRDTYALSNGVRVGARMAFNPRAFTGHEISYSYQHAGLDFLQTGEGATTGTQDLGSVRAHHMYYNYVLHATPSGIPVRPFVTGGGGFSSFFLPGLSSLSGRGDTKFGYNYGGGVKFNLFMYGVRFDVRNHVTGKPFGRYLPNVSGSLHNLEFSITFSLLMG